MKSQMQYPMPTHKNLHKAREEFNKIEPRDFFYWSVTRLVAAVLDTESRTGKVNELVRVLMMLLTTWNKNFYRFFDARKPGITLEQHFTELENAIIKHFKRLMDFRNRHIYKMTKIPDQDIRVIFEDFSVVLGRVGAAKCLHLLAPGFFPLWDAAILKGYGLEKGECRHLTNAERYIAFINISKCQIINLGKFSPINDNPLKSLDEYNYCRFTKKVDFS